MPRSPTLYILSSPSTTILAHHPPCYRAKLVFRYAVISACILFAPLCLLRVHGVPTVLSSREALTPRTLFAVDSSPKTELKGCSHSPCVMSGRGRP